MKVTHRGDLDGNVLNINNKLCIDGNCNLVDNGRANQLKYARGYIKGFRLVFNGTDSVIIEPGACRDFDNTYNIESKINIEVSKFGSGTNAKDVLGFFVNNWYAVHIIADTTDTNPTAGLLSQSADDPTLPTGYNKFRRVGWVRFDEVFNIKAFCVQCSGKCRIYCYDRNRFFETVLVSGTAAAWTSISLGVVMPPTSRYVRMITEVATGDPGDFFGLRPGGSNHGSAVGVIPNIVELFSSPIVIKPSIIADIEDKALAQFKMCTDDSQNIEYAVHSVGGGTFLDISVVGFTDEL